MLWGLSLVVVGFTIGCISAPAPPKEKIALLKVQAQPTDTRVYVNGRFAGRASVLRRVGKPLQPGVQYVTFVAPGYFPHDERIDLSAGETTVKMKLRPIPQ